MKKQSSSRPSTILVVVLMVAIGAVPAYAAGHDVQDMRIKNRSFDDPVPVGLQNDPYGEPLNVGVSLNAPVDVDLAMSTPLDVNVSMNVPVQGAMMPEAINPSDYFAMGKRTFPGQSYTASFTVVPQGKILLITDVIANCDPVFSSAACRNLLKVGPVTDLGLIDVDDSKIYSFVTQVPVQIALKSPLVFTEGQEVAAAGSDLYVSLIGRFADSPTGSVN